MKVVTSFFLSFIFFYMSVWGMDVPNFLQQQSSLDLQNGPLASLLEQSASVPLYLEGLDLLNNVPLQEGPKLVAALQAHAAELGKSDLFRDALDQHTLLTLKKGWVHGVPSKESQQATQVLLSTLPVFRRFEPGKAHARLFYHLIEKEIELSKTHSSCFQKLFDGPLYFLSCVRRLNPDMFKRRASVIIQNNLSGMLLHALAHPAVMQRLTGSELATPRLISTALDTLINGQGKVSDDIHDAVEFFLQSDARCQKAFQGKIAVVLPFLRSEGQGSKYKVLLSLMSSSLGALRTAAFKHYASDVCTTAETSHYITDLLGTPLKGVLHEQSEYSAYKHLYDVFKEKGYLRGIQLLWKTLNEHRRALESTVAEHRDPLSGQGTEATYYEDGPDELLLYDYTGEQEEGEEDDLVGYLSLDESVEEGEEEEEMVAEETGSDELLVSGNNYTTILCNMITDFFGPESSTPPTKTLDSAVALNMGGALATRTMTPEQWCAFLACAQHTGLMSSCSDAVALYKRRVVSVESWPLEYRCMFLNDLLLNSVERGKKDKSLAQIIDTLAESDFKEYAQTVRALLNTQLTADKVAYYRTRLRHMFRRTKTFDPSPEVVNKLWGPDVRVLYRPGVPLLEDEEATLCSYARVHYMLNGQLAGGHLLGYITEKAGIRLTACNADDGYATWVAPFVNEKSSAYVVHGQRVYCANDDGTLMMLDLNDGSVLATWSYPLLGAVRCMACVDEELLIAASEDAWCLIDLKKNVICQRGVFPEDKYSGRPCILNNYLVYRTNPHVGDVKQGIERLVFIDLCDAHQRSHCLLLEHVDLARAVWWWAGDAVWYYANTGEQEKEHALVAVCSKTGEVKQRIVLHDKLIGKPLINSSGDMMYVVTWQGVMAFRLGQTAQLCWELPREDLYIDRIMLSSDGRTLYGGCRSDALPLVVIDAESGAFRFSQRKVNLGRFVGVRDTTIYIEPR